MIYKPKIGSGDFGFTDFYGKRIRKDSFDVLLVSLIDEINALISVVCLKEKRLFELLSEIQKLNMKAMGNISGYVNEIELKEIKRKIEIEIEKKNKINNKKFVLFGKEESSTMLNLIRTKIRVAEIIAWKIKKRAAAVYLNRLSDLFFLLSLKIR